MGFSRRINRKRREEIDPTYKKAVQDALDRDDYTCQMCFKKMARKYLEVHHIIRYSDSISLRSEVSNLITLCRKDHKSIKGKEKHYVMYFVKRVEKNEDKNK